MKMDNRYAIGAIVILVLLVGGYLITGSSGAVVSAVGESSLKASPDKVSIYLQIDTRNKTAEEAKENHDIIVEETITELIKLGFSKDEIKTLSYNIYPDYFWDNGKQTSRGFVVSQQLLVETDDFKLVDDIVDSAVRSGALVSYINFELSQERQNEYKAKALEEAGKDAKSKAEATARGLGKSLGGLVSVKSEEFNYGPYVFYEKSFGSAVGEADIAQANSEARTAVLNLAPQDVDVRAVIRVEYKLSRF